MSSCESQTNDLKLKPLWKGDVSNFNDYNDSEKSEPNKYFSNEGHLEAIKKRWQRVFTKTHLKHTQIQAYEHEGTSIATFQGTFPHQTPPFSMNVNGSGDPWKTLPDCTTNVHICFHNFFCETFHILCTLSIFHPHQSPVVPPFEKWWKMIQSVNIHSHVIFGVSSPCRLLPEKRTASKTASENKKKGSPQKGKDHLPNINFQRVCHVSCSGRGILSTHINRTNWTFWLIWNVKPSPWNYEKQKHLPPHCGQVLIFRAWCLTKLRSPIAKSHTLLRSGLNANIFRGYSVQVFPCVPSIKSSAGFLSQKLGSANGEGNCSELLINGLIHR